MTDHLSFDQLCDLADGVGNPGSESSSRAHLRTCEECMSRFSAISALAAGAAALPQSIAPPADLWDDIRAELVPRRSLGHRRATAWQLRYLAAAAVVIAVASSALTALMLRDRHADVAVKEPPSVKPSVASTATDLPPQSASAEHGYAQSVTTLQHLLDERRDSLAPSTVATVERSIRIADSAIAEARDALTRDPANRALAALFASNYERKIDLLRRATELAPRT